MNFSQFDLWDILADIVPGAAVILLFTSLLPNGYVLSKADSLSVFGLFGVFLLIAVCYVIGWVTQATALKIDRRLTTDSDLWRDQMKAVNKGQTNETWNFPRLYYESCQLFFAGEEVSQYTEIKNEIDEETLRHLTYSYLNDNDIGRSHRFHVLCILSRSLYVVFLLAVIGHVTILLLSYQNYYQPALSFNESLVLIIALLWGSYIMWGTRKYMEKSMIKCIMGDFYTSQFD